MSLSGVTFRLVPLTEVPLALWEPRLRHWVLPGGMVARNGFPGMCVPVPAGNWVELLDAAAPASPRLPLLLPGPWWLVLPMRLSSCDVACWRSRGIESVTPITRIRAVAEASTGRSHTLGVRST